MDGSGLAAVVGNKLGLRFGCDGFIMVGEGVGAALGADVSIVGDDVGVTLDASVGAALGANVGVTVGDDDGV